MNLLTVGSKSLAYSYIPFEVPYKDLYKEAQALKPFSIGSPYFGGHDAKAKLKRLKDQRGFNEDFFARHRELTTEQYDRAQYSWYKKILGDWRFEGYPVVFRTALRGLRFDTLDRKASIYGFNGSIAGSTWYEWVDWALPLYQKTLSFVESLPLDPIRVVYQWQAAKSQLPWHHDILQHPSETETRERYIQNFLWPKTHFHSDIELELRIIIKPVGKCLVKVDPESSPHNTNDIPGKLYLFDSYRLFHTGINNTDEERCILRIFAKNIATPFVEHILNSVNDETLWIQKRDIPTRPESWVRPEKFPEEEQ